MRRQYYTNRGKLFYHNKIEEYDLFNSPESAVKFALVYYKDSIPAMRRDLNYKLETIQEIINDIKDSEKAQASLLKLSKLSTSELERVAQKGEA